MYAQRGATTPGACRSQSEHRVSGSILMPHIQREASLLDLCVLCASLLATDACGGRRYSEGTHGGGRRWGDRPCVCLWYDLHVIDERRDLSSRTRQCG